MKNTIPGIDNFRHAIKYMTRDEMNKYRELVQKSIDISNTNTDYMALNSGIIEEVNAFIKDMNEKYNP